MFTLPVLYNFNIKMCENQEFQMRTKQRQALRSLEEISNMPDSDYNRQTTFKAKKRKKQSLIKPQFHHRSTDLQNCRNQKIEKLPLIPSKPSFQGTIKMQSEVHRAQGYVMFEKGLGCFGTVQIKKEGVGRYVDSGNKFMKFYSETNQQQIELIKLWLRAKKQSWRSVNSFFHKKKVLSEKNSASKHLQIRNIL